MSESDFERDPAGLDDGEEAAGEDEPLHDDMIEDDAAPLDTDVEDADFFLGEEGGGEDA
jgi:hypothetical protein